MTSVRPRINQVEELTRGISLPLEPLAAAHLGFIAGTLQRVLAQIAAAHPQTVATGEEVEITSLMEIRLNKHRAEDPAWSQIVVHVVRGAEAMNFDGASLEKQPDLSIYLTDHDPQFPLVVECKIIDKPSGKGVDTYCRQGLSRFVAGEYAWAKSEALMMGYVRDNSTLDAALVSYLKVRSAGGKDPFHAIDIDTADQCIVRSRHSRRFTYVSGGGAPGPIAIYHVWTKG